MTPSRGRKAPMSASDKTEIEWLRDVECYACDILYLNVHSYGDNYECFLRQAVSPDPSGRIAYVTPEEFEELKAKLIEELLANGCRQIEPMTLGDRSRGVVASVRALTWHRGIHVSLSAVMDLERAMRLSQAVWWLREHRGEHA